MHLGIPRLVLAVPMVAALAVTMSASGPSPISGNDAPTPALRSISSRLDGAVSTVLIETSEPVAYLTSQPDPMTVFVDLRNMTAASLANTPIGTTLAPVVGVDIEDAQAPDGAPVARVRVLLDRVAKHRVRSARNVILVEVDRGTNAGASSASSASGASAAARTIAPKAPAATTTNNVAPTKAEAATELRSVRTGALPNGYAVTLSGNGALVASSIEEARDLPHRVLLDFQGVNSRVPAVTPVNSSDVQRVRVATNSRDPLITRVVIDLAKKLPYTVETVGEELRILFNRAVEATAAAVESTAAMVTPPVTPAVVTTAANLVEPEPLAPVAPEVAAAAPVAPEAPAPGASPVITRAVADTIQPAMSQSQPPLAVLATAPAPAAQQTASAQAVLLPQSSSQAQRTFSGDPVTLDFQGADLRAVLRTFAEISGLNIVIDPAIQGTVDVSLRDVPWDQALDIILRANKLGYSVDGTIVRIVPLNVLAQENEDRKKLQDAAALAGNLQIITRPLSYAKAADLVPIITRSTLSARGDVQIDSRTNTLIIRDLADRLVSASDLITALDRPQPQVEIEARIIQTNRDFARSLGVQWGFNGRVDPTVGTTTGLAFPSSAAVRGNSTGTSGGVPSMVDLAVAGPTSGVGIALGSINGALNLDVALSALERTGRGRVLSTPRVSTQNNIAAEITQGVQIPYQTVSNNTVTVTFKDAALTLKVTPQITASNTVIMNIFMENASPDFARAIGEGNIPPINTQRAVTTVLVGDGDTTVIGGIYVSTETDQTSRTPYLHRLPLLGWLFKRDQTTDESRELLIFITPRIAK